MVVRTLVRQAQKHHHHRNDLLTPTQAQQLHKLSLDTLLRRLQSSSLTNPARSLEVHFQLSTAPALPSASPVVSVPAQDTHGEDPVPLRGAISDALLAQTGLGELVDRIDNGDAQRHEGRGAATCSMSSPLTVEEWGLLAANCVRHGLDGQLTRLAVARALESIQLTHGQPAAMVGNSALIRVLEACVDSQLSVPRGAFAALSLESMDALVAAVESVWDGAEGWRTENADLSLYALFAQFLGLTLTAIGAGEYHGCESSRAATSATVLHTDHSSNAPTATATTGTPSHSPVHSARWHGSASQAVAGRAPTPPPAPPRPVSARRWTDVLLPRLTLAVDPELVMARGARLCADVCQHLVEGLGVATQHRISAPPPSSGARAAASLSDVRRLCQIAQLLEPENGVGNTAAADITSPSRSLVPAWLSFARPAGRRGGAALPAVSLSPVPSTIPTFPAEANGSSDPPHTRSAVAEQAERLVGSPATRSSEWSAARARTAVQLRRVALAQLCGIFCSPPSGGGGVGTHPLLESISLTDVATLLYLTCDPALSSAEADAVFSRLAVHASASLELMARRHDKGGPGSAPPPRRGEAPPPNIPHHLPRSLADLTTLCAIVSIGELQLKRGTSHGTASLFAAVLQCISQAAPLLWREAGPELWKRACALVDSAPLIARDAATHTFWALATVVAKAEAEASRSASSPLRDRRAGLLTLIRWLAKGEAGRGPHAGVDHTDAVDTTGSAQALADRPDDAPLHALIRAAAVDSLATSFSQEGLAGLRAAVRTLTVFTAVLEKDSESCERLQRGGSLGDLGEVCWHVVAHTLEDLQTLSLQLSSPARPWTSLLSASELSSLRHALRWASAAPQTAPANDVTTSSTYAARSPDHATPDTTTADGPKTTSWSAATRRAREGNTRQSQMDRRAASPAAAKHVPPASSEAGGVGVASLSEKLHRQLVVQ